MLLLGRLWVLGLVGLLSVLVGTAGYLVASTALYPAPAATATAAPHGTEKPSVGETATPTPTRSQKPSERPTGPIPSVGQSQPESQPPIETAAPTQQPTPEPTPEPTAVPTPEPTPQPSICVVIPGVTICLDLKPVER